MTKHTPEKVTDLIAEARRPLTDLDITQSPAFTKDFIRRLADALEAETARAERLASDHTDSEKALIDSVLTVTAERDEALSVIAEVRKLPRYSAFEGDRVWSAVDADDLLDTLSRIPEHPKGDQ